MRSLIDVAVRRFLTDTGSVEKQRSDKLNVYNDLKSLASTKVALSNYDVVEKPRRGGPMSAQGGVT